MKHTILGAGGSIGNALAHELLKNGEDVRLVSRSGFAMAGAGSVKADLTSYQETLKSVQNSDIVYLCAGLPYDTRIWSELWPVIMQNSINACKSATAKFVFFDNVYMYGKVEGIMTENTPYNPCSRKGEVRASVAMLLENEIKEKNINAIIARSADIYGPYATKTSLPYVLAINNLINGKRARWLVDDHKLHSFSYTIDCAKGMIMLSGCADCYNQTWHLPTSNPIDGETFIHIIASDLGVDPDYILLNKWLIRMAGIFDKTASETYEVLYQNELNYNFDSTKFNDFFKYSPKSYYNGIRETIDFLMQETDRLPGLSATELLFIK